MAKVNEEWTENYLTKMIEKRHSTGFITLGYERHKLLEICHSYTSNIRIDVVYDDSIQSCGRL